MDYLMYIIVCPLVFLAGFVDSIAGGGGLISLPAYLLAGLPIHNAIATNKLSSCIGTVVSTARLVKNKFVDMMAAPMTIVAALIGSFAGANLSLLINERILQIMLIVILPFVAFYLLKKKNLEPEEPFSLPKKKQYAIMTVASLIIGAYDGFYGPGTGTFLLLVFTTMAKMDVKTASGNVKLVNLSSNVAALVTFILAGKCVWALGIAASVFSILGHFVGSGLVMKNGSKIVKPIICVVIALLFVKIITDMI